MDLLIKNRISDWTNYTNLDQDLKDELASMNEEALIDAFYDDIAFGTGGLRGIIGVGTNRMNVYIVRKTTLGYYQYLNERFKKLKATGIVISYDCRHFSEAFAKAAAEVFASRGVKVYLFSSLRPTPELSFAIRYLKASGGIMITASHNPPNYNGYKVYDEEGCQLVPDLADQVIDKINQIKDYFTIEVKPFDRLVSEGLIELIDNFVDGPYLKRVEGVIKKLMLPKLNNENLRIVFTPLHGTASVHLSKILKNQGFDVIEVKEQMIPDPDFKTVKSPNPEDPSAFTYAIKLGKETNADLLIATDPDADRMGVAVKQNGEYILLTGNQTGAIILEFLAKFKPRNKQGVVFNTIVSSNIAKAICEKYDLKLVQTLTGFKFIGEQAKLLEKTNEDFFFGYEESYGYVIEDFVRDKDALQSALVIAIIASYYKDQGLTLVDSLENIFKEYGYFVEDVHNIVLDGIEGKKKIEAIMRYFQKQKLLNMANKNIIMIEDYDCKLRYEKDIVTKLTLPQSLVLKYTFDDGGWWALRPSGTEPKLKIYMAVKGINKENALMFLKTLKAEILAIIERIK